MFRRSSLRAAWVALSALGLLLITASQALHARADDRPRDMAVGFDSSAGLGPALGDARQLPSGYVTERRSSVRWVFPTAAASEARSLMGSLPASWQRISGELTEASVSDSMVVGLARSPEELRALAPPGAPPPEYASGVTYPALGLILITLTAPETWERPALDVVLAHELSHLALYRVTKGHDVPLWLTEGLAVHQSREATIERLRTLWEGAVRGRLVPLSDSSQRFPRRAHEVNLAYAQSADFVGFLLGSADDARKLGQVLARIGGGELFEDAVRAEYHVSIGFLEREWRDRIDERYTATPLLLSGGGLWVLAAGLIVLGYARRRRKAQETIRRWEEEEANAAARERERARAEPAPSRLPEFYSDSDAPPRVGPELRPERDVPTIVVDGVSHTLH